MLVRNKDSVFVVKINIHKKPRLFNPTKGVKLRDMGNIFLGKDEQMTFFTKSKKHNDVTKKEWGFYLSNSVNHNLKSQGFKTAIVIGDEDGKIFINLVEIEKIDVFIKYLKRHKIRVLCWLDELKSFIYGGNRTIFGY